TGTSVTASISFTAGVKQTLAPNGTTSGLNVGSVAGDPSVLANGDVWYNSTTNQLSAQINSGIVRLGAGGGGSPGSPASSLQYNNGGSLGGMSEWLYSSPTVTVTKAALNTTPTELLTLINNTAAGSTQKQFSGSTRYSGTTYDNSIASPGSITTDTRIF